MNDPRFSSGLDFENKPIAPELTQIGNYTFVNGYDTEMKSTLGMYFKNKEVHFLTYEDGYWDTIMKATFNADDIPDFILRYAFEDHTILLALISKSNTEFIEDTFEGIEYCDTLGDTINSLQLYNIYDVDKDGVDEVVVNAARINEKLVAVSCTDTLFIKR